MDESEKHHNPNPVITANPLSRLFFWWMNPFMKKGYGKTLEVEDMYNVCPEDKSQILGDKLERAWEKEVHGSKGGKHTPRLFRALFRIYGLEYILLICLLLIEEAIKIGQPLLLGELITYFTPNPTISSTQAYLYAAGISMCTVIVAIIHHPYFFGVTRIGMQIKIACCSLMYRKCLRLSHLGYTKTTTGQIVNLMSNDVNKIDFAVMLFPFVFTGPVVTIAAIVILWKEVGVSTLAGIAVVALFVGIQAAMSRLFSKFREKTAKYTDRRVTIMNEIIAGIRIIKIYCWEQSFGEIIKKIRSSEIHSVRVVNYLASILETISRNGKHLCIYAVVLFLTVENRHFRASELYITVALLNALSMNVLLFLSLGVKHSIQMAVAIKRIQEFLMLEEFGEELGAVEATTENIRTSDCLIEMRHVSAIWNETFERQTLHDISAYVRPGQLLAVIGPVGAGKSSMLMAILRELPLSDGSIDVNGRLAYVSQQPWVFSASLRQNIIFGNEFKQNKYDEIVVACALDKDIAILPYGDRTLIGDRGVKLSGGQRSRISLARALYMGADIYLLDDPFSAVDANVGKHIFTKKPVTTCMGNCCLPPPDVLDEIWDLIESVSEGFPAYSCTARQYNVIQGILKRKPKILVTHQLQFLHDADQIIILKEGKIIGSDTFDGLSISGIDFTSLMKTEKKEVVETNTSSYTMDDTYHLLAQAHRNPQVKEDAYNAPTNAYLGNKSLGLSEEVLECKPGVVQLPPQEEVEAGTVNWRVYFNYLKSGAGVFKTVVLVCVCVAAQVCFVASDWWLSQWSNENEERFSRIQRNLLLNDTEPTFTTEAPPLLQSNHNLIIYSGIIGAVIILGLFRGLLFFKVAVDASEKLHNSMFASITRARIGFFDTNPVGRVLNRFSKDVGLIDELLPFTAFDFLQTFLWAISYVLVAGIINPWVFIAITPLSVIFFILRHYYLRTSRQVQRLEGITRSPVFTHISASLQGLHSIRALGVQDKFVEEFDGHQDLHTEAWFLVIATTRWLAVILDWLCVLFIIAVSFSGVLAAKSLDAGRVGFSMTYAMAVMLVFQWMVRQSSLVENQMVSVERVLDYSKLPSEAPLETDERQKPPSDWPQQGEISTRNACLTYSDATPFILKELTFTILPREKIGVVGRTGAGKSSLITMLTRLVESEGEILIDGINIRNLGLHELRNSISVIPQDPVLFTGTLRRNLDPFENHKDSALWKALARVEQKQSVDALPHGLDTEVAEGGTNFSVGQRQLICLARAILKHNKILIIDEATANVDPRTDQVIQKTIREKFQNCTVLTIAHRLYTVMDSDRLLVLNEGKIIEFDIPYLLLQNTDSCLSILVSKMSEEAAQQLLEMAKSAYSQKNTHKTPTAESFPVKDSSYPSQENNTVVTYL